jgi:CHAT domain-containing protein
VLIDPIENAGWLRGIDEIAIVPHGVLHYLPYAALIRTSGTTDRFLIDDYVICYLPAASILARQEDPRARTERLIAYAPDPTLPYTAGEARSIVSGFGSRGTAVIGRNATETSFKRVASDYDLIHFATHGYFNKMNPLFSGVELKADAENDGRLEVYEILNLRLKAQLVTLSACDTAMGAGYFTDIPAGDEFVGLTRAFLSAGASAVAATLWEVNDSSTAQLMRSFYLGLTKHAPAEALAAAQRRMLHGDPAHSHPYYWSAFVVVGKGNSVEAETLAERR